MAEVYVNLSGSGEAAAGSPRTASGENRPASSGEASSKATAVETSKPSGHPEELMTDYLVATASVHVTAAAADYLEGRLDPNEDSVVVVGVREPDSHDRDAGDAANVARSRLAAAMPETELREGDPTAELLAAVDDHDPDVVIVGANGGTEGASGVGSTATALLSAADRPVVVVPLPAL